MVIAFIAALLAGALGWRRAAAAGGNAADKWQYAAAHSIPAFLVALILMTVAARMGWLG